MVLALAALFVFHRHLRTRLGGARAAIASLLFAGSPVVWLWTAAGMETPLVLLLQLALWALVDRIENAALRDGREGRVLDLIGQGYQYAVVERAPVR